MSGAPSPGQELEQCEEDMRKTRTTTRATRVTLIALLSASVVGATTLPAQARYSGTGMPRATFSVNRPNYSATWNSILANSEAAWNGATVANISRVNGSAALYPNQTTVGNYTADWYGIYVRTYAHGGPSPGYRFSIRVNSRRISQDASNFSAFSRSVYTHELGHALNLSDNPTRSHASIMNYSRNRNSMVTPQAYDRTSVNNHYR